MYPWSSPLSATERLFLLLRANVAIIVKLDKNKSRCAAKKSGDK